jgi:antitoxin VapB
MEHVVETHITRVLSIGDSQVVRIPEGFRLNSELVRVSRNEQGDLVIHPWRADRGAALLDVLRAVGEEDVAFIAALEAEQARWRPPHGREGSDSPAGH